MDFSEKSNNAVTLQGYPLGLVNSCFAVTNTKDLGHKLSDDLEIHFVELPKWHRGDIGKLNSLERSEGEAKTMRKNVLALHRKGIAASKIAELLEISLAEVESYIQQ